MTPTAIYVGIGYETNGNTANAALGAAKITQGDPQADAQAVVKDINAHGGLAGRRLVPVWNALNAESTESYSTIDEQACQNYTVDNHSFVVVDSGLTPNFLACVARTSIQISGGGIIQYQKATFRTYPYLISDNVIDLDRAWAAETPMLVRQNYFAPWDVNLGQPGTGTAAAKIGILAYDQPDWSHALYHELLPSLASYGYHVSPADIYSVTYPTSSSQDGSAIADISSAELHMHADGVDHVLIMDGNGDLTLYYSNDAYSQHYYPRYGVDTADGVGALVAGGVMQPAEAAGAEGLGWAPTLDLPATMTGDNSAYSNPSRRHCIKVMNAAGQTFSSTNAESIALGYCDELYLVQRVIDSIHGRITRNSFIAALDALGYGFQASEVMQEFFGPNNHEGVIRGYDMRYDASCQCTPYYGSPVTIP
ncbi:MAG: hypothetical protein ACYDB7_07525 [Mycobacteriales bacterium]